ncbi:MAG: hypothetical protein NC388_02115 [Clostridium sp.]|nr:hypothetical protein [Clostridium sp.]
MRSLLLLGLFVAGNAMLAAQQELRVMSYNAENLFDTIPDTGKDDREFLPASQRGWNSMRYWRKLNDISRVISAVGEDSPPDLVALCEVENDTVMRDLTVRSSLRQLGYRYVMTDSPDRRGVDVALLWQPGRFRLLASYGIRVPSVDNGLKPTRDVLYAKGRLTGGDTLHVLVCHLPSKAGGRRSSQRHRRLALSVVRHAVDSLLAQDSASYILVAGDFNCGAGEKLLRQELRLAPEKDEAFVSASGVLHALTTDDTRGIIHSTSGSYRYQGNWSTLDHLLVSDALYRGRGQWNASGECTAIADFPFLLEPERTHGGKQPFRTYRGPVYHGGYSDHLPVFTILRRRTDGERDNSCIQTLTPKSLDGM